jgi:hypothetical protein
MQDQVTWALGKPGVEDLMFSRAADPRPTSAGWRRPVNFQKLPWNPLYAMKVTNPPAEPGAFELGPLEAASGRWRGPLKM